MSDRDLKLSLKEWSTVIHAVRNHADYMKEQVIKCSQDNDEQSEAFYLQRVDDAERLLEKLWRIKSFIDNNPTIF